VERSFAKSRKSHLVLSMAKLVDRDCQSSRPLGCPVLEASTKETGIDYWEENLLDGTWRVVKYLFQDTYSEVIIMHVQAKFQFNGGSNLANVRERLIFNVLRCTVMFYH